MSALDSIEVDGYKSIHSARIEFGAVNVLIGANGAGQSNLAGVFGPPSDLADHRLQLHIGRQGGADAILYFGRKKTAELRIALRLGLRGYEAVLVPSVNDALVFEREVTLSWDQAALPNGGAGPSLPARIHLGRSGHKETELFWHPVGAEYVVDEDSQPVATAMRSWRRFHFHDTGG